MHTISVPIISGCGPQLCKGYLHDLLLLLVMVVKATLWNCVAGRIASRVAKIGQNDTRLMVFVETYRWRTRGTRCAFNVRVELLLMPFLLWDVISIAELVRDVSSRETIFVCKIADHGHILVLAFRLPLVSIWWHRLHILSVVVRIGLDSGCIQGVWIVLGIWRRGLEEFALLKQASHWSLSWGSLNQGIGFLSNFTARDRLSLWWRFVEFL